jgi:hypothetical protein
MSISTSATRTRIVTENLGTMAEIMIIPVPMSSAAEQHHFYTVSAMRRNFFAIMAPTKIQYSE